MEHHQDDRGCPGEAMQVKLKNSAGDDAHRACSDRIAGDAAIKDNRMSPLKLAADFFLTILRRYKRSGPKR